MKDDRTSSWTSNGISHENHSSVPQSENPLIFAYVQ
ncbi:hypothetical protein C367_01190 [Cryptococcus neoformans Ze90-1]|nr:hypothetical protein C367_01190 [Cryptococcus neoformans var. grubii Ze90-1]